MKDERNKLQVDYNVLEDDRDEWEREAEERQINLVNMTAARGKFLSSYCNIV